MQQQEQPTQTQSTEMQTNNVKKSKQKRSRKIVIRDPKDKKDVTHKILHGSTAFDRSGDDPPLTNLDAQTESSKIQAQSAPQVASRLREEKGKQVKEALFKFFDSF